VRSRGHLCVRVRRISSLFPASRLGLLSAICYLTFIPHAQAQEWRGNADLTTFEYGGDGNPNIIYLDKGQHLNQLYFDSTTGWHTVDLTAEIGGPLAIVFHSISGQVTADSSGLGGVTISLTGTTAAGTSVLQSGTTNSNGSYAFSVPSSGTYTVTPSLSSYAFNPGSTTFSSLSANQTANFGEMLSITGNVDAGFGVTMTLSGSMSATTATDGSGNYSFSVPARGSYTVTPSLSNHTFSPTSQAFNSISSNHVANFTSFTSGGTPGFAGVPPPPTPAASNYVATAASSGIVYVPNSQNPVTFICYQPPYDTPVQGCDVQISTGYYPESNAHLHESSSHPHSSASPSSGYTDVNGNFQFSLNTTLIGQVETVTASSNVDVINNGFDFAVGYNDLYFGDTNLWIKIGGSDTGGGTGHGTTANNRYMTLQAYNGLWYATEQYLNNRTQQTQICVNDATLPIGGKFDITDNWSSPHKEHDRGSAVDIADTQGQCPAANIVNAQAFAQACRSQGAVYVGIETSPPHVHCNWQSKTTYPH
jgi:hypothetical protein